MSKHVTNSYRKSLRSLVNGEEQNGLELLRYMYVRFEGGAEEVEVADLGALHDFPPCTASTNLQNFLGEWLAIVQEQGEDLPQRHLRTLLVKMLPQDVKDDLKRMKLLKAPYMDIVDHLQTDASRWIDTKVAQHHIQRRFSALPTTKQRILKPNRSSGDRG